MGFNRLLFIMRDGPLLRESEEKSVFMTPQNEQEMLQLLGQPETDEDHYPFLALHQGDLLPGLLAINTGEVLVEHLQLHTSAILKYFALDEEQLKLIRDYYPMFNAVHLARIKQENRGDVLTLVDWLIDTKELREVWVDIVYKPQSLSKIAFTNTVVLR